MNGLNYIDVVYGNMIINKGDVGISKFTIYINGSVLDDIQKKNIIFIPNKFSKELKNKIIFE